MVESIARRRAERASKRQALEQRNAEGVHIDSAGARSVQRLVKSIFGGDRLLMLQHLLADDPLSEGEMTELRQLIDKRRREKKDAK